MPTQHDNIMKKILIKILRILVFFMAFVSCGIGYAIFRNTLVGWWVPVGVALLVAVVSIRLYNKWGWLTTCENKTVNVLCHLIGVGSITYMLFLAGNYCLADSASTHEEEVMVQNKYQETHKKTRRVSKRRIVSDGVRKEYYLEVAFNNGSVKTLYVSLATYNKAKPGKPKKLTLRKGFLGIPVITKGM